MKYIALYLPQYYPTDINNKWYGNGFTEWVNVASARKLFPGHYQPHVPADLGFYDLRLKESRRAQAEMAQEYGIDAFCYWTYWFGAGVKELDMPIWEVFKDKEITLPFCLAWANHSWEKKLWDKKGNNQIIIEQKYLGEKDYTDYFYEMLPLFKDKRYFRHQGKLFFIVYNPLENAQEISKFIRLWRDLAQKENLEGFFFVGRDSASRNKEKVLELGLDAIYNDNTFNIHHCYSWPHKILLAIERMVFKMPTVIKYKKAIDYMVTEEEKKEDVVPVIAPNWDHSPRSGRNAILLHDCKPIYFEKLLRRTEEMLRDKNNQLVLVKAWNEWGEGNHLEPDRKYGKGYLECLKKIKKEFSEND
jgi:hypothetical protein